MGKKLAALGISSFIIVCIIVTVAFVLGYGHGNTEISSKDSGRCPAYSDSELTELSELIAVGTVTDVRYDGHGTQSSTFKTERTVKGDVSGDITIQTQIPYANKASPTDMLLAKGEKYLMFLDENDGYYTVIAGNARRIISLDDGTYTLRINDKVITIDEYCEMLLKK